MCVCVCVCVFNVSSEISVFVFSDIYRWNCYQPRIIYPAKVTFRVFPGGPVLKNPFSNAGDRRSISGGGTKIPHAGGQLSLLQLLSLCTLEPTWGN